MVAHGRKRMSSTGFPFSKARQNENENGSHSRYGPEGRHVCHVRCRVDGMTHTTENTTTDAAVIRRRPSPMTFRLSPELRAAIEQVAAEEGCSTSVVIRRALTDLLADRATSPDRQR